MPLSLPKSAITDDDEHNGGRVSRAVAGDIVTSVLQSKSRGEIDEGVEVVKLGQELNPKRFRIRSKYCG